MVKLLTLVVRTRGNGLPAPGPEVHVQVVQATGGATAVSALARMQGFVIPVETVTQDGSYKDWNSR